MHNFTKELVDDLADKLLIGLTPEENQLILNEFNIIDETMELITKIPNISEVTPMTHALDNHTYTPRKDEKEESVKIEDILANCDSYEGREIKVPKVVGGE